MIDELSLAAARVPFAVPFAHAAHRRMTSESVLLTLRAGQFTGWGEGAPRSYVTGETIDSVGAAVRDFDPAPVAAAMAAGSFGGSVRALAALRLGDVLPGRNRREPAAAAAVETAALDALCRAHGRSVTDALQALDLSGDAVARESFPVTVTADLTRPITELLRSAGSARAARHLKLKAAQPDRLAAEVVELRRALDPQVTLSVDANGSWTRSEAMRHGPDLVQAGVDWIEEPLPARDWTGMRALVSHGVPVMLDESCTGADDLAEALAHDALTHVNVRISKVGGPLAAARLIDRIRRAGLAFQIGVQVGEIGPLWACGRALASWAHDAVTVEAGRQDEWFPAPLTEPAFVVDRGSATAQPIPGPGHGVTPSPALHARLTPLGAWAPQRSAS
ncbi:hypothetical protein K7711_08235 [Nocardia sp. CA2R105]|uniref:enolase C-terminal domain-like protein n=1 Tax=Nocardia coffeae TaxID=2873381 RepID=UPI001CA6708C|nr:enolase C-terminal domain-like protein [Nocardia coffeae]MBY8856461.1 hypothetical protein [Nocardia coffeae]